MLPFTNLVFTELAGADVITCHLAYSPVASLSYVVEHSGATDIAVLDLHGRISDLSYSLSPTQATVTCRKRSDYYAVLVRRREYLTLDQGLVQYVDTWTGNGGRYALWFFPPQATVLAIRPPTPVAPLYQWQGSPLLATLTNEAQISVQYTIQGPPVPPLSSAPFDLEQLLGDFAPPHGTEGEILCAGLAALPDVADLLGGAVALRAILAQKLALNLAAPGTMSLLQTA